MDTKEKNGSGAWRVEAMAHAKALYVDQCMGERMADPPLRLSGRGMPAFDWTLSDQDVADVLTYIRNSWGNQAAAVDAKQVGDVRKALREYGPRYRRLITQSSH